MVLEIRKFPDPVLRKKAVDVTSFDNELRELVSNMAVNYVQRLQEWGSAAPQIGVSKKLFIIDISEHKDDLMVFINPVITKTQGEITEEEGCLSFPGEYAQVTRFQEIEVTAFDIEGKQFTLSAQGFCQELFSMNWIT